MQPDQARAQAAEIRLFTAPVYFHGRSMEPFLREADQLTVEPAGTVQVGDVVVARDALKFPALRVVARTRDGYLLQGDNWPGRERVSRHDILGRVTARQREGRRVIPSDAEWRRARSRALWRYRWALLREGFRRWWGRLGRWKNRLFARL